MAYKTSVDLHDISLGNIELESRIKTIKGNNMDKKGRKKKAEPQR